MSHRNETINPHATGQAVSPHQPVGLSENGIADFHSPVASEPIPQPSPAVSGSECDSMSMVVSDVEAFTRGWIGRIRRLIHRSSQLIERESLLAGAIARLDQQKSEWSKRTATKEAGLRDQSKRLTEAWLEVEAQRRKAIQGARAAATSASNPGTGPIVATPVSPASVTPVVAANVPVGQSPVGQAPVNQATTNQVSTQAIGSASPVPTAQPSVAQLSTAQLPAVQAPAAQVPAAQVPTAQVPAAPAVNVNVPVGSGGQAPLPMAPVSNTPIDPGGVASTDQETGDDQAFREAEAATRQKIEEFKRMQRAIRSNRRK